MISSAYLFQIARDKSFDYLVIIYVQKFWVWFFFDRVYFVSRLTGPTYINIIGQKMTALIDMLKLVKKYRPKISFNRQRSYSGSLYHSKAFSI